MEKVNLYRIDPAQVRHFYIQLRVSYSRDHDHIVEMVQNAIDAIRKRARNHGHISLTVNVPQKTITIEDNGCGIAREDLAHLILPFATDKNKDPNLHGEKGVGIPFLLSTSNRFVLTSTAEKGSTHRIVIQDFANDLDDEAQDIANKTYTIENLASQSVGTKLEIGGLRNNRIFEYTVPELIFLLRTKTAIGNTRILWDKKNPDQGLSVELNYIGADGKARPKQAVATSFWTPKELSVGKGVVTKEEWDDFVRTGSTDDERINFLREKIIMETGTRTIITEDGKGTITVPYLVYYLPSRDYWAAMTEAANIVVQEREPYVCFRSGAEVSIKGAPMDIQLPPPERASEAGILFQFYFLFDYPFSEHLDLGRKKLLTAVEKQLVRVQNSLVKEISARYKRYTLSTKKRSYNPRQLKDQVSHLHKVKKETHLQIPSLLEIREDSGVFGALLMGIGKGLFKNLSHYSGVEDKRKRKHPYEVYLEDSQRKKTLIVNCGFSLKNVFKEYTKTEEMFAELDWIVVWRLEKKIDNSAMEKRGLFLEPGKKSDPYAHWTLLSPIASDGFITIVELEKLVNETK